MQTIENQITGKSMDTKIKYNANQNRNGGSACTYDYYHFPVEGGHFIFANQWC